MPLRRPVSPASWLTTPLWRLSTTPSLYISRLILRRHPSVDPSPSRRRACQSRDCVTIPSLCASMPALCRGMPPDGWHGPHRAIGAALGFSAIAGGSKRGLAAALASAFRSVSVAPAVHRAQRSGCRQLRGRSQRRLTGGGVDQRWSRSCRPWLPSKADNSRYARRSTRTADASVVSSK